MQTLNRGSNLANGHAIIDEGIDPRTGVGTRFHFQGDQMIAERYQDMEGVLEYVREMREKLAGQPWGEGKPIGYIPPLFYSQIQLIRDRHERSKAVKAFFREHPAFCYYPAYLKD